MTPQQLRNLKKMQRAQKRLKWKKVSTQSKREKNRQYYQWKKEVDNLKKIEDEKRKEKERVEEQMLKEARERQLQRAQEWKRIKEQKRIEEEKRIEELKRIEEQKRIEQKKIEKNMQTIAEPKQILRVKPLVELEDPTKTQNAIETQNTPKSYLKRTIVRIVTPKSQPTEEKKYVVSLNSGIKFVGSSHPQYPNQKPKKFFLIRRPNEQTSGEPELFTLPEDPNPRKFVVKEVPKSDLAKTLNFVSQQANLVSSIKTPVLITKKFPTKNSKPGQKIVQIPAKDQQKPSTSGSRNFSIQKQVLMKEMVLLEESRDTGTPEPQMLQDPIDISGFQPAESFEKEISPEEQISPGNSLPEKKEAQDVEDDPFDHDSPPDKKIPSTSNLLSISSRRRLSSRKRKPSFKIRQSPPKKVEPTPKPKPKPTSGKSRSTSGKSGQITGRFWSATGKIDPTLEILESIPETNPQPSSINEITAETLAQSQQCLDFVDNMIFANLENPAPEEDQTSNTDEQLTAAILDAEKALPATNLQIVYTEKCDHCNREFPSYKDLVKHWIELKNVCEICDVTLPFPFLLQMHLHDFHEIKGYKCRKCHHFDKSLWNLKLHRMRGHCLEYQHPCENCDRAFSSAEALKTHLDQEHETERRASVLCDFCGRGFNNYYVLRSHIEFAHLNKKFNCKQCGKGYMTRATYSRHLQTHKTKKIVCEHCGKSFNLLANLRLHMRQHTGEKPYTCSICSKTFAKSNTLRQHLLIHSGKRPYVCDICGKSFTQKPGLSAHRKSHPGDLPNMPCLFIDNILKELPDDAFQNSCPKNGVQAKTLSRKAAEEKEDDVEEVEDESGAGSTKGNVANSDKDDAANSKENSAVTSGIDAAVILDKDAAVTLDKDATVTLDKDAAVNSDKDAAANSNQNDAANFKKIDEANSTKQNSNSNEENQLNLMESDGIEANFLAMVANEANIMEMDANEANILEMVENENTVLEDILEQAMNIAIEQEIEISADCEISGNENDTASKTGEKRKANDEEMDDEPNIRKESQKSDGQVEITESGKIGNIEIEGKATGSGKKIRDGGEKIEGSKEKAAESEENVPESTMEEKETTKSRPKRKYKKRRKW